MLKEWTHVSSTPGMHGKSIEGKREGSDFIIHELRVRNMKVIVVLT